MNFKHFTTRVAFGIVMTLLASAVVFAQCAMCKATIANSENAAEVSKIINTAVLVLLIPAVTFFSFIIGLVLKFRHSQGGEMYETMPELESRHQLQDQFSELGQHVPHEEGGLRGTY